METTILLVGWFLLMPIVFIVFVQKWPTLLRIIRFISFFTTVYLLGLSFFIWLEIRDNILFLACAILSIVGGLVILSWPLTSPKFVKKYDLKW